MDDARDDSRPPQTGDPHRWWILALMLTAELMDLLDSTVVNVAGPALNTDLGAGPTGLQWIIGGYPLALGAGLILGGRLGDRYGRRTLFLVGMVAFTAASLGCALAPSVAVLIGLRLVQGVAAAVLLPQGLGLLKAAFPPAELGQAFAVFGPAFGIAGILGPVIGGGLISADLFGLGWRAVFLVNVPIGVAAAIVGARLLPGGDADRGVRIDGLGAVIAVVASGCVVLPLIQGREAGWPWWTWALLVTGVLGYLVFVLQQRRLLAGGGTPLVVPSIFRRRAYVAGLGGIALFFAGSVRVQLILTLFLQLGHGYSAGQAGLANLPLALGSGVGGAVCGVLLADRLGRGVLRIGAVVQLVGAGALYFGVERTTFSIWWLVPGLVVTGVGTGIVVASLFNVLLAAVEPPETGSASGVLTAVQSIASSVGVAVFGSVFFGRVEAGDVRAGFAYALLLQMGLVVVFLLVSPTFPRRAQPDWEPDAETLPQSADRPA